MIYRHGGSYEIAANIDSTSYRPEYNAINQLIRSTWRIQFSGAVRGADQGEVKTAGLALQSALLDTQVLECGFIHNDGTTEAIDYIDVTGFTTENGIVCTLDWIDRHAEYITKRSFVASATAVILGAGALEFEYTNRIVRQGFGGPSRVARRCQGGVVIQEPYASTEFSGVESGQKVSRFAPPTVKPPTFPSITLADERSSTDTGEMRGPDGIWRYWASWNYALLSDSAF
jgi:hypothetical protein